LDARTQGKARKKIEEEGKKRKNTEGRRKIDNGVERKIETRLQTQKRFRTAAKMKNFHEAPRGTGKPVQKEERKCPFYIS